MRDVQLFAVIDNASRLLGDVGVPRNRTLFGSFQHPGMWGAMTFRDDIEMRASELARSGRHRDCFSIEAELAYSGYPEVYVVLLEPKLRARLDDLCRKARSQR